MLTNKEMVSGHKTCCDRKNLKKGKWNFEEDQILTSFIHKHGHENWHDVAKQAGLPRCGKSCRLRWMNYLRPDIKRGNFTDKEMNTITKLRGSLGNKWSKIASQLPGRTANEIKNLWNTYLKKGLVSLSSSSSSTADSAPYENKGTGISGTKLLQIPIDEMLPGEDEAHKNERKWLAYAETQLGLDSTFDPKITTSPSSNNSIMEAEFDPVALYFPNWPSLP